MGRNIFSVHQNFLKNSCYAYTELDGLFVRICHTGERGIVGKFLILFLIFGFYVFVCFCMYCNFEIFLVSNLEVAIRQGS